MRGRAAACHTSFAVHQLRTLCSTVPIRYNPGRSPAFSVPACGWSDNPYNRHISISAAMSKLPCSHDMDSMPVTAQSKAHDHAMPANAGMHPIFTTECICINPASFKTSQAVTQFLVTKTHGGSVANGDMAVQAAVAVSIKATSMLQLQPETAGAVQTAAQADLDQAALQRAALLLQQGQVVAMPTETVYGLAANALDADAVRKVFAAKGRPGDNPLIIHISSLEMLSALYPPGWSIPPAYAAAVAALWPGPLTILLPRSPLVPDAVTCGLPTMAVRMPSHPVALALIEACAFPLAAPSANSSGRPSPTLAAHVMSDLASRIPLVLDGGPCGCGVESTVLDALRQPPAVLRPGGATYEQLRDLPGLEGLQVYRKDFVDKALEEAPTTPGMKYRHYSPDAKVVLIDLSTWAGPPEELAAAVQLRSRQEMQKLMGQGVRRLALLRTTAGPSEPLGLVPELCSEAGGQLYVEAGVQPGPGRQEQQQQKGTALQQQEQQQQQQLQGVSSQGNGEQQGLKNSDEGGGCRVFEYVLGAMDDPGAVARELFCALRLADQLRLQAVVVEGVREENEGLAVMNRLRKAASSVIQI